MLPIKQVLSTFAPEVPIQITLLAVVTADPASTPKAIFNWPVVLFWRALKPLAGFKSPVLRRSADEPMAVLAAPVVLLLSALKPLAVLLMPMVLLRSANAPLAVFHWPIALLKSAPAPVAVLLFAVLAKSAPAPIPVLKLFVVLFFTKKKPSPVCYPPTIKLKRAL